MEKMDEAFQKCGFGCDKLKDNFYALNITTKEEVEKVIHFIQEKTKTTWSVRHTRVFLKEKCRRLFKRLYSCHLSTRRRKTTEQIKPKKSRNINCPAHIVITIKKVAEAEGSKKLSGSRKERADKLLQDSRFPCLFEFRKEHNHAIESEEALKQRPVSESVKVDLHDLLNRGHSVSSAYHTYYTTKVEECGDDYASKMIDRHQFPSKSDVSNFFKKYGKPDSDPARGNTAFNSVRKLESILSEYALKNGTTYRITQLEDDYAVSFCTPIMKRALQQMSDVIFVDSSGYCDVKEHKMYFFLTQSTVGCLPVGCIISNSNKAEIFDAGVKALLEQINIQPTIILTDEEILLQNVLQKYFPYSKFLLGTYHVLNASWKYINTHKSEILRYQKHQCYQRLRDVVYAESESTLNHAKLALQVELEAHPKFAQYMEKLYSKIDTWCLLYRQYIVLRGNQPFNYVATEESFRIFRLLKDIPLSRTRLFKATHLADFMCSSFELFYTNRILEMVNNKNSKVLEERYHVNNNNADIEFCGNHQYVYRKPNQEESYKIDTLISICTCPLGTSSKSCEHHSAVIEKCGLLKPVLTNEEKSAYYYVVKGVSKSPLKFFPGQTDNDDEDDNYSICSPAESLHINDDNDVKTNQTQSELESVKNKWISYCNQIVQHLEKDPTRFIPAVNVHLNNVKQYATSVPTLLKGFYAGFPYKADTVSLPPLVPVLRPLPPLTKRDNSVE